jgi:hypothetical protein
MSAHTFTLCFGANRERAEKSITWDYPSNSYSLDTGAARLHLQLQLSDFDENLLAIEYVSEEPAHDNKPKRVRE